MIHKLILTELTSFEDALRLLDSNGNGFLPVVNASNKLLGILTDGDIRRAILNNTRNINEIINRNPSVANISEPRSAIIRRLHHMKRRHMPVVDNNGLFVDVVILNDFNEKSFANKIVIMAGGLGSRLGTLTQNIPKPMLPIQGRPILEYIIENLKSQGFTQFILCLNHKAEIIKDYFQNGEKWNVVIEYTQEDIRLGTAGALSLIEASKIKDPLIVLNADIVTNIDFQELLSFHNSSGSHATMCIKRQAYEIPFACVEFDESMNIKSLIEKPKVDNYINAGIYVLSPDVLPTVPKNEFYDMPSLFHDLIKKKFSVKVFTFEDYWVDIGHPKDYFNVKAPGK
jgi:dTDP-glucose pyrophosphorylase